MSTSGHVEENHYELLKGIATLTSVFQLDKSQISCH